MTGNTHARILLVEDNPRDVELTLHAFKRANVLNHVQVASDGEQALRILFGDRGQPPGPLPDVIILDLKLPKVDGHEVLRRLRADPRTRLIPVAVLTSSREETDLLRSYDLGANGFLVKPVDMTEFVAKVGELGLYWAVINRSPPTTGRAVESPAGR